MATRSGVAVWAVAVVLIAGGLLLWRDHGLSVAMSGGAWLCITQ